MSQFKADLKSLRVCPIFVMKRFLVNHTAIILDIILEFLLVIFGRWNKSSAQFLHILTTYLLTYLIILSNTFLICTMASGKEPDFT